MVATETQRVRSFKINTYADQAVLRLELQGRLEVVIDEGKASGLGATKDGLEAKDKDAVDVVHLEHLGQLLLQLGLRHVGAVGVVNIDDLKAKPQQHSGEKQQLQ